MRRARRNRRARHIPLRNSAEQKGHSGLVVAGVIGVGVLAYLLLHKGKGVMMPASSSSVLVAPSGGGGGGGPVLPDTTPTIGSQFTQSTTPPLSPEGASFTSQLGPETIDTGTASATATSGYGHFDPSRTMQRPKPMVFGGLGAPVPWTDISQPHWPDPRPPAPPFQNTANRGIFDEPYGWANPW